MERYKDIDSDSGVLGYEINNDNITVWFHGSARPYTYSYASAGSIHVEEMKKLAHLGNGLNAYINNNVKFKYVRS
ncbi:hypothetical protein [Photobacterium leiognathi]|uniref:hypothetical protein n=1 Tax=Photobacterium leiognathi TaxID=553611 RepID=UPI0029826ED1|nr:hypothetical protein [Photobacterium leiognathi]